MRYYGGQALGLVETVGLVPALEACDKMLKASNVKLVSYENVGSTLVTIMVVGDVAAVEASVEAGAAAAAAIGKLTSHNVMPRPIPTVGDIVSVHDIDNV
ncbi:BMC domain-containing protein [Streptococcus merionis]|uniref:Bacterial microcompartments family protein n=1 Tax=Streptococcus merionis TaxID=400065 RepID=A0A239T1W2_9STRE|nr:BMC domain-containing protein [Streptococcus merionis]SNU90934.1 bacterial microcompartments family protein [Streptococcus merionis]